MKTQLLEDIGENSSIASLVPSGKTVNPAVQQPAAETVPPPAMSHIERGVWRYKTASQPVIPEPSPPPQELASQEPQPAEVPLATAEPVPEQRMEEPVAAIPAAEPELPRAHDRSEGEAPKPLFDFSPPPAEITQNPEPFTRESSWFERWGRRYAFVGAGLLAVAGLAAGGMWMIKERKDESALALIASGMKASPPIGKAVTLQPTAAKVSAPTSTPEAAVAAPVAPAAVARAPEAVKPTPSEVPKLVLLPPEPDTAPPKRAEPKRKRTAEREEFIPPPKRARAAEEKPPVRQVARAPVVRTETKTESTSSASATLEACRAHGYNAAQCVKRACRVTKFGFVCPGK